MLSSVQRPICRSIRLDAVPILKRRLAGNIRGLKDLTHEFDIHVELVGDACSRSVFPAWVLESAAYSIDDIRVITRLCATEETLG